MSRAREWAEELSALAAKHHGRPAPSDTAARVVLTAEERSLGYRADGAIQARRAVVAVTKAVEPLVESFRRMGEICTKFPAEFWDAISEAADDAQSADFGEHDA